MPINVLITGGSGYIGGHILASLSADPKVQIDSIFVIIRDARQSEAVKGLGYIPVVASLEDRSKLIEVITGNDISIVVHTATSSVWEHQETLLEGLAKVKQGVNSARDVFFLTIAGSDAFSDTLGWDTSRPVSDLEDVFEMEKQVPTTNRRIIDLKVHHRAQERGVYSYTVFTPLVFGEGKGFGNKISITIPALVRAAKKTRQAKYVRKDAHHPLVHIDDISRLWIGLLRVILQGQGPSLPHGLSGGAYFCSTGSVAMDALSGLIAAELYRRGQVDSPVAIPFASKEQAAHELGVSIFWVDIVFGTNLNWKAEKGQKALGWTPRFDLHWFRDHFKEEIDAVERYS